MDFHCNILTLRSIHSAWLGEQIKDAKKHSKELAPVLKDFKAFIENNPRIYMYFHAMYDANPPCPHIRQHPH